MTDNKKADGLRFILKLDIMADDERKLVQLAREIIDDSHDKRTFLERKNQDLQVNPTSINLGAAIGASHAMMNNNLSTNDKLYMVMNKYLKLALQKNPKASKDKALERFCKDFAAAFPKEYGMKPKNTPPLKLNLPSKDRTIV
jgi:hypothetical protein